MSFPNLQSLLSKSTVPEIPKVMQTPISKNATPMAEDIINSINKIRMVNKLPPLIEDKRLVKSANEKAQDMTLRNYWSHVDPDGKHAWPLILNAGYNYDFAGENLANKYNDEQSVIEWMTSPSHRANILNPNFTNIGIGRNGNFNVLHFGKEKTG